MLRCLLAFLTVLMKAALLTFLLFYYIIWEIIPRIYRRCLTGRSEDEVMRSLPDRIFQTFAGGGSDYEKIL